MSHDVSKLRHVPVREEKKGIKVAKLVKLKPSGYPLRALGDEKEQILETDNPELFQAYAREQWGGLALKEGDFVFDSFLYPDYAFQVVRVAPGGEGRISPITKIQLDLSSVRKSEITKRYKRNISLLDVIGQEQAKKKSKIILHYLKDSDHFGEWAPRNVLFYGPPGTGKTMLSMALAAEARVPIYLNKATDLLGHCVGDGARRIHKLYDDARRNAPCIVFIDEFDAIGLDRQYQNIRGDVTEIVNALLSELDGIEENLGVVTICVTNAPALLDEALKSRFEEEVRFTLPTEKERLEILNHYVQKLPLKVKADLEKLATLTEGSSGRDLKERILKNALYEAILDGKKIIREEMLLKHLDVINIQKREQDKKASRIFS
ncbi:MAG: AAA family ATPase [Candidatus Wukongarchaeota archaeon]|nr:AAA family ATPase [Candidatus Wukongarchaeota archaeon]MDO8130180.1 AAA family ATPase [Candidatus Wukongarchaeota archaeon]